MPKTRPPASPPSAPGTPARQARRASATAAGTGRGARAGRGGGAAVTPAATATAKTVVNPSVIQPGPVIVGPVLALPWRKRWVRPEDLAVLEFEFVNLRLVNAAAGPYLTHRDPARPATLVVHFPPQGFGERTYRIASTPAQSETPEAPPIPSRISGSSRLALAVPARKTLPYTATGLLQALGELGLEVVPTALPATAPARPGGLTLSPAAFSPRGPLEFPAGALATGALRGSAAVTRSLELAASAQRQLDNRRWSLALAGTAYAEVLSPGALTGPIAPRIKPRLQKPGPHHTAIEAPWRLLLSPSALATWMHALLPVSAPVSGRTELWHTRLATRTAQGASEAAGLQKIVRAVDSPDANLGAQATPPGLRGWPYRGPGSDERSTPMHRDDRHEIVHLSANQYLRTESGRGAVPLPVRAEHLSLSALGAGLRLRGAWDPTDLTGISVASWQHRATLGRDQFVEVVRLGFLLPFGHKAVRVDISERRFPPGQPAHLRTRTFIIVQEPEVLLGQTGLADAAGLSQDRKMPFRHAALRTLVTPDLDSTGTAPSVVAGTGGRVFWPRVGGADFPFRVRLTDLAGQTVDLLTPLLFAEKTSVLDSGAAFDEDRNRIALEFQHATAAGLARRRPGVHGQTVHYAPPARAGDTAFETEALQFTLYRVPHARTMVPVLEAAAVSVPAIKHLLGQAGAADFVFPPVYLRHGLGGSANGGEVFLQAASAATGPKLDFGSQGDRSGGLLQPSIVVQGLSRTLGPVAGDVAQVAAAQFDPASFFGPAPAAVMPLLFGCIPLSELIGAVSGFAGNAAKLAQVPRLLTEQMGAFQALLEDLALLQARAAAAGAAGQAVVNAAGQAATAAAALLASPQDGARQHALRNALAALTPALGTLRGALPGVAALDVSAREQLDRMLQRLAAELAQAQQVVSRLLSALEAIAERKLRMQWEPVVKPWPATHPIYEPVGSAPPLVLSVELRAASAARTDASFEICCRLNRFRLNLLGSGTFLRLHFQRVQFLAASGRKPDVTVDFERIEFVGVLSFVETLRTLIPLDGFSDPPNLSVTPEGIEAGFSLALPSIAVGVFNLSNLSLGAAFTVPFIGQPLSVRFNFCERHNPFNLTVAMFGGGGFFGVTVTPAGVQVLEAAFEFGAGVAIDFGVASGSVKVVAGIYFRIEQDAASLSGYFRLNGRVSVLGLISASIELYLELTYHFASGKCVGVATLTIEVEVLLFSATVRIRCERRFAGANGDPGFVEMMSPYVEPLLGAPVDPWAEYCEAFA